MIRPQRFLIFLFLILFTISTGYALDAQLKNVAVALILHADGNADVFYDLTYDVSVGELPGFYFEVMAVEPVFVREDCYAILESGNTVPLEIKKLAEKYYDIVLAEERSFSGTAGFYLHYRGDMAAAGSIRRTTDSAGIEYYRFDWAPVQWASPINERIVRIVLPIEVSGERVKEDFLQTIDITIMPETKQENVITFLGTKGDNEKYLLTLQFRQVDIAPYRVQHIEFSAPGDQINSEGKLNKAGSTAPALSLAENRYSRIYTQRFYSPVLFLVLAAAAGSSAFLLSKKRRSLIETSDRYQTAASLGPASQRSDEAGGEASVQPQYRFFSLPFPIRLLLYLGIGFCGLVLQFLLSLPGHVPIGFALVLLAGILVMMQTETQNDEKRNTGETPEQWRAISPAEITQIRKNLEIEEIKKEPIIVKKIASRTLFFSLFGFLLFFAAVVTGITGVLLPLIAGTDLALFFFPVFFTGFMDIRKVQELSLKMNHVTSLLHYTEEQNSTFPLRPFVTVQEKQRGVLVPKDVVLDINPDELPQGVLSVEFKPIVHSGLYGLFPSLYAVCYPKDQPTEAALVSSDWLYAEGSSFIVRRDEHRGAGFIEVRFPPEKEERLDPSQRAVLMYTVLERNLSSLEVL